MKPVAHAALVALMLAGGHQMAVAGIRVSVAQPYAPIRARSYTVDVSGIKAPASNALPVSEKAMKDGSGNLVNIASTGDVRGVLSSIPGLDTLTLTQYTKQAIVRFSSFDIGSRAAVNANMTIADSTALYQITSGTDPSKIFGSLTSNGTLYLINQSGILFGPGAQVNVQGILASTMKVDNNDYLSNLSNSTQSNTATFWSDGSGVATYAPEKAFVKVAQGAKITTGSGGKVFLLGGQVENAGEIISPSGQVVLAAGTQVYLTVPDAGSTPLYMAEANNNVPTLKGVLVEVNGRQIDSEFASNTGSISTPTGNATIVGWAVNQMGRINATTSLSKNGSVYLLARSGAKPSTDAKSAYKYATVGGALTLGPDSSIDIQPDATPGADGKPLTAAASAVFTPSRVELSGQTIEFQGNATSGASIVAPGGTVNVRAALTPAYIIGNTPDTGGLEQVSRIVGYQDDGTPITADYDETSGRIVMSGKARIDVSGTRDTTVSVARNFVTAPYVGEQDISDAPMQKDGPIFHHDVTFDLRGKPPILTSIDGYTSAVQKTAGEFLSTGGKVVLSATGSVAMGSGTSINVSGGAVNYTSAYVSPTVLYGEDGTRYTLNTAPADVKIVGMVGLQDGKVTRFGTIPPGNVTTLGLLEPGYTDGKAAGALSVYAPVALMDGSLAGGVVTGSRQKAGLDPLAAAGVLRLGTASNGSDEAVMGKPAFVTAVLRDLRITQHAGSDVPDSVSRISADQINAGGFGQLLFNTDNSIEQQAGADLNLPALSSVNWQTLGKATVAANIVSKGGTVTVAAHDASNGAIVSSGVTVKAGSLIDVSGNWVNQWLDGKGVAAAVAGGTISLLSDHSLSVESNAHLDVSGGVTVTTNRTFTGTAAGTLTLQGLNASTLNDGDAVTIGSGVLLEGYGLNTGGKLFFKAGNITVAGDGNNRDLVQSGAGAFTVGAGFFSQGGFQSFDLDGVHGLTIAGDTSIAPQLKTWQVNARGLTAATGAAVSNYVQVDKRTTILRNPVNLTFNSSGHDSQDGRILMQARARIDANPLANIAFNAVHAVELNGVVRAQGGTISATTSTDELSHSDSNHIQVGSQAVLDVSGGVLLTPNTAGLSTGKVYDGGTISLLNSRSGSEGYDMSIDIQQGAQLMADGGIGVLDVASPVGSFGPAYTRQTLASNGGNIVISAGSGGAYLGGSMTAAARNGTARGGTLSLALGESVPDRTKAGLGASTFRLTVQDGPVQKGAPVNNQMTVSTTAVANGGFASLSLQSADEIYFVGNTKDNSVTLSLSDHLRLDAAALRTDAGKNTTVNLSGGSTLQLGYSADASDPAKTLASSTQATEGAATLNASGGLVELFGTQATQGFGTVKVKSASELRLRGFEKVATARSSGAFNARANLTFNAQQVTPTTSTDYTISTDKDVTFGKGDASAATPLSAQATLTVNADTINQNGVIRVPFGQISLHATKAINLGDGSVTSVSGEDLLVPYGSTSNSGKNLQYNGADVTSLKGKAITVDANGQTITADTGATLDLDGGGKLVAWEFVAGPGGSKDIFAGALNGAFAIVPTVHSYTPYDTEIVTGGGLSVNPAVGNALSLGNTLTFGTGSVVPAGTYAVLPARYALLPGAYLVKPNSSLTNVAMGFVQNKADGSQVVAAVKGVAGSSVPTDAMAGAYTVMTSAQARRYSEVRETDLDTYMVNNAIKAGTSLPALMGDAGRLSVLANKLELAAQIQFNHLSQYRGGQLDIASQSIHVGDTPIEGALNLSYAQLNASHAESILLGGIRQDAGADGFSAVTVYADDVKVDAASQEKPVALSIGDIAFAATNTVDVADGVHIEAPDTVTKASSMSFTGDGALLRVSSDATATSTRSGPAFQQGTLSLGKNIALTGGSITAEATLANNIDTSLSSSSKIRSDALTVGANRIAVGETSGSKPNGDPWVDGKPLVIDTALAGQFNQAKDLTLRSFSALDMYGNSQLGSSTTRSLTIDSAAINVKDSAAPGNVPLATLTAGAVTLANTTKSTQAASEGTGALKVDATGANGGSGHVTVAGGAVALSGVKTTSLNAAGSVVMQGNGSLSVPGDLGLRAQTLTATRAADAKLTATGRFSLDKREGTVAAATPGAAAALQISANAVAQNGQIVLPSGKLTIASNTSVGFGAQSVTDVSGLSKSIDGLALSTVGGDLLVTARAGDITAAQGSVLNASAGLGKDSSAGSMTFSAVNGKVDLQGTLLATSTSGQKGGSLSIDAKDMGSITALAQRISAETSSSIGNFAKSIALRERQGDMTLDAGATLSASNIGLSADAGKLTVAGNLYANGDAGGTVSLNAGSTVVPATVNTDVVIDTTADIQAKGLSDGGKGGIVAIGAGAEQGTIRLNGGTIDTSGKAGDGTLNLRAIRTADANGLNIDDIKTSLVGVKGVVVEAARIYQDVNDLTSGTAMSDASTYLSNHAQAIADRLTASQAALASKLQVRAGIEVRSDSSMDLSSVVSLPPAGGPINLTLRAAGDLNVSSNISSGFTLATAAGLATGTSGDIRLVGGADLSAADTMATHAAAEGGDVNLNGAIVRTTTGNITINAAQDVNLNGGAAVYTTGTVVPAQGLTNYTKPATAYLGQTVTATSLFVTGAATPFLDGGGNVSIKAGRDVAGATDDSPSPATSTWALRFLSKSLQTYWANRYDKFKQGFATFGGGDIDITAGHDLSRVNANATSSGYSNTDGVPHSFGGGSVSLQAGNDVVGGNVLATHDTNVIAGHSVTNATHDTNDTDTQSLRLGFGDGDTSLLARNDLTLDRTAHFSTQGAGLTMYWSFGDASLDVAATAGDVAYRSVNNDYLPGDASFTSASGNLQLSSFKQAPAPKTALSILANGNVTMGRATQFGIAGLADLVTMLPKAIGGPTFDTLDTTHLSGAGSSPTRIVAETGSVEYGDALFNDPSSEDFRLITPLRMIAGLDIREGGTGGLFVQHQSASDVSLIQAGRDYAFYSDHPSNGLRIDGPGDVVVVTGRDLNLQAGAGIQAAGNTVNHALPTGSAAITILNGVALASGDVTNAAQAYYPLLGGTGVGAFPDWLYTQIMLGTQTPGTPQASAIAAQAAAELATRNILDVARTLAGETAYEEAITGFVNHRQDASLTTAQALAAFTSASNRDQAFVAGQLLSKVWVATVPDAMRQQQVLSLVPANSAAAQNLIQFVAKRTGQDSTTLTLSAALAAYARMSIAQQAVLVTQTLSHDMGVAIAAAAAKPQGAARNADYEKAYDDLSTVFPHAAAQTAQVDMGASEIRTFQDSPISIFSPNGGVNVGQLVDKSTQAQSDLGIVTVGGGDVSIVVRDDVAVNKSRVFTLNHGDETIWSSLGSVDAGRGAKSISAAPDPVYYYDPATNSLVVDVKSAISGNGIASSGAAYIAAPKGQINAGDAGISSKGTLYLVAPVIVGGDNIHATATVGAPPPPSVNLAAVAAVPTQPTAAGPADEQSKEDSAKAKKRKRNVILDFLGFGSSDSDDADKKTK
jgi:filamentous hemagglutinin family protein